MKVKFSSTFVLSLIVESNFCRVNYFDKQLDVPHKKFWVGEIKQETVYVAAHQKKSVRSSGNNRKQQTMTYAPAKRLALKIKLLSIVKE